MNLEEFIQVVDTLAAAANEGLSNTNEILESYNKLAKSNILEGLSFIPRGDGNEWYRFITTWTGTW